MDLLKLSMVLYPSLPGGPRYRSVRNHISSKPLEPTYDFPKWWGPTFKWMWVAIGVTVGALSVAEFIIPYVLRILRILS